MNPHPNDPKGQAGAAKTPLHLIPTVAMSAESQALKQGAERYGLNNWRESGVNAMTYVGAMLRHLTAWRDGEDVDPDSGISHLGHIRANCAILLDAAHVGKLVDDRPVHRSGANPAYTDAQKEEREWVRRATAEQMFARMNGTPEGSDIPIPDGLPPLPPVPEGFDRWVYRGTDWCSVGWTTYGYVSPSVSTHWIVSADDTLSLGGRGHYIEAVKD